MMEIPAGKWCEDCRFGHWCGDDFVCVLFLRYEWPQITFGDRLPECLSAYPNGATIEIKPK